MGLTSYPNVTINASNTIVIDGRHDSVIFTSTLGTSVNLQIASIAPAGLKFWAVQYGTSAIGITAGSGATANALSAHTGTGGQYSTIMVVLVTDGNAVFTGDTA